METWREELYHHGILGMKWGVRRYQNYDGTYTQAGVKRYREAEGKYNQANRAYKSTKKAYKSGTASMDKLIRAKEQKLTAKTNLDRSYDDIKKRNAADKGHELYRSGKTIEINEQKDASIRQIGRNAGKVVSSATAVLGAYAFQNPSFKKQVQSTAMSVIRNKPALIAVGAGVAAAGAAYIVPQAVHAHQNTQMRAYWHADKKKLNG